MNITLSLFDLLILIGMVTGIICSILLFRKSDKKPSNKFLGLGILSFVWLNTKTLLHSLNLWEIHGFGFFPNGIELAIPPLFYFYLKTLTQPNYKFRKKEWLHFVPFFISQFYAIVVYIVIMQTQGFAEKKLIAASLYFDVIKNIDEYLMLFNSLIYLYYGFKSIQNYKNWLSQNTSDTQLSELSFLKNLFFGFLIVIFYSIFSIALNPFLDDSFSWRWQLNHLLIATLVYYMGLVGYKNSDIVVPDITNKKNKKSKKHVDPVDLDVISELNSVIEKDKVHLNPKLSLQELAKILNVNEISLSNTINNHYNKNFRSFIKELRVEEVKTRLRNEGLGKLSLLGLAKECGFNSEASFYRIFKEVTGVTPKQFLMAHSPNPIQKT